MIVTAAEAERIPALPGLNVLLCGSAASRRSSLALHYALYHAAHSMLPVLFLCCTDALEQDVPLLPHQADSDDPALHMLHIKYLRSALDLQRWAACLPLLRGRCGALVVEDITQLVARCPGDERSTLVRTLALLVEGAAAYRAASGCPRCPLLVTDSSDEARRPRYIYDRWFPLTLTLTPHGGAQGPDGAYCLAVAPPAGAGGTSLGPRGGGGGARQGGGPDADAPAHAAGAAAAAPGGGPRCVYRPQGRHLLLEAVLGLPYGGGGGAGS